MASVDLVLPTLGGCRAGAKRVSLWEGDGMTRIEETLAPGCTQLLDVHGEANACISHLRSAGGQEWRDVAFVFPGQVSDSLIDSEVGVLVHLTRDAQRYTVWIPPNARQALIDG